jgi:hypothetical protein
MLNLCAYVREERKHIEKTKIDSSAICAIDCNLVPNKSYERSFFAGAWQSTNMRPFKHVVSREVTLLFVRRLSHATNSIDN